MSSGLSAATVDTARSPLARESLGFGLLAASISAVVTATAWHGGDLSGQIYRTDLTRAFGYMVWDAWWYTGHYLISYSVLSQVVSAVIGLPLAALVAAAVSAWAFDRLIRPMGVTYGQRRVHLASLLFAINTAAPILVGQITFLMGEAVGLLAILAATKRRRIFTVVLAGLSTLFSPVAGLFVVVALVAMIIASPRDRAIRSLAVVAAVIPMLASAILLREFGVQPFLAPSLAVVLGSCAAGWFWLPRSERALRLGCLLYGLGALATFAVPNPLGGNIVRLVACVAVPVAVSMVRVDRRKMAAIGAVGLMAWQWTPAISGLLTSRSDPSLHQAYFAPLVGRLASEPRPTRLEIPFTRQHWESAYVAPHVPLARGWERQTDRAENPIFYSDTPITAASYRAWLDRNGVSWVALPDVPLDYSSTSEAALIRRGLPYLHLEWSNAHWKLWKVVGSPGLVDGPATVSLPAPDKMVVDVHRASTVTVRVRYTPTWHVTRGRACLSTSPQGWTTIRALGAGRIVLVARPGLKSYECPTGDK